MRRPGIFLLIILLATRALPVSGQMDSTSSAHDQAERIVVDMHRNEAVETLHLALGRSIVLTTKNPLKKIYVGNPSVLQSYTSGPQEIVLTAKAFGLSSLVLWDTTGHHHMYSFSSEIDADGIRASFHTAFPNASIAIETLEGRLLLTGSVPTDAVLDAASKMATSYTKDVVNALRVIPVHGKQVQLKLRIVEVDRSRADQFGINVFVGGGRTAGSSSTQQFPGTLSSDTSTSIAGGVTASDPLNLFLYNYKLNIGATIKDLESKQILQVLAEPTLTTLSGIPARFLSGGEFPVPVVQGGTGNSTAISIIYRPYGVKVDFTPTVNADGTIRLKVSPEVSTLDYTNSVTISGSTVPALSTRRAETEVEIRNGESFVVSGLLDHRTTDSLGSIPGIANIPILGQLFRSKNLNRSVIELVVLVTATVVDPLTQTLEITEPAMSVPNMESSVFDARVKETLHSPATPAPSAQTPPTEKP